MLPCLVVFCFILNMYFRKRVHKWVKGAEGERDSLKQHGAWCKAGYHGPGIMTWAKIKSQTLNWLSHPGALPSSILSEPYGSQVALILWIHYCKGTYLRIIQILNLLSVAHHWEIVSHVENQEKKQALNALTSISITNHLELWEQFSVGKTTVAIHIKC